jgi:hypothetical protein
MVNMGAQIGICARKVVWRVNNNKKPVIFCDILYHLNDIFLQRVFEALKRIFSNAETTRKDGAKAHPISTSQIKYLGEIFLMV